MANKKSARKKPPVSKRVIKREVRRAAANIEKAAERISKGEVTVRDSVLMEFIWVAVFNSRSRSTRDRNFIGAAIRRAHLQFMCGMNPDDRPLREEEIHGDGTWEDDNSLMIFLERASEALGDTQESQLRDTFVDTLERVFGRSIGSD